MSKLSSGQIIERKTSAIIIFYGLQSLPTECEFTSWDKPLAVTVQNADRLVGKKSVVVVSLVVCSNGDYEKKIK